MILERAEIMLRSLWLGLILVLCGGAFLGLLVCNWPQPLVTGSKILTWLVSPKKFTFELIDKPKKAFCVRINDANTKSLQMATSTMSNSHQERSILTITRL
jgi:hypothetical protein